VPPGQLGAGRHDSKLLLPFEDLLPQRVPAPVETALVPVRPLGRHVVRRMRGARGEVNEERLVRHQRLLLANPADRLIGHVRGEVVALLGGLLRFHRRRALVDRRVVLIGLAADEAVEVLEAAAAGRPGVEGSDRAGLPDRHLVALAELRRRVAVQPQRLRERRACVRSDRVVARRRGGQLGDHAHPHRVVVTAGEQRRARRRAQRRGVEAVVLQAARGQPLRGRRLTRPAERARGAETDIIKQDHEHIGCPGRWSQRLDRRELGTRVPGVERELALVGPVRDWELLPPAPVVLARHGLPFFSRPRRGARAVVWMLAQRRPLA
jgi:hypothetical protein